VLGALAARGGPVALVEIGSGGHLAATLNDAPGADRVLAGAWVTPTAEAMARLLDLPAGKSPLTGMDGAKKLAAAAARRARSPLALAVGPVESGPEGSRGVWVTLRLAPQRWETRRFALQGSGEIAQANLTTPMLDQLRRWLR
jgi:nicotinamide mononucleotide (NMN) deamidase PncC